MKKNKLYAMCYIDSLINHANHVHEDLRHLLENKEDERIWLLINEMMTDFISNITMILKCELNEDKVYPLKENNNVNK